jgi:hypothetical protein
MDGGLGLHEVAEADFSGAGAGGFGVVVAIEDEERGAVGVEPQLGAVGVAPEGIPVEAGKGPLEIWNVGGSHDVVEERLAVMLERDGERGGRQTREVEVDEAVVTVDRSMSSARRQRTGTASSITSPFRYSRRRKVSPSAAASRAAFGPSMEEFR